MSNVYIYDQGTTINYKENRLILTYTKEVITSIPIEKIDNVLLFGNIQVTTPCMQHFLTKGINLTWLSKTGSYFGRLESTSHVNIDRQRLQFRLSDNNEFRLNISKKFITGKALNQKIILLRGNRHLQSKELIKIIAIISNNIKKLETAPDINSLMGIEGYISKLYFQGINLIIDKNFTFEKRTKRPPKDPFNAMLSFGYTLLQYEFFTAIVTKGLNPYASFLHSDKHKHPSLCSDMMEEWRAILVDTLVMAMINTHKINKDDFEQISARNATYLTKDACKKFVKEFEKRLRQEVSYITEIPYKMSFRRIIEYQVMLLIKALESKNTDIYKPVLIR
ncbi:CRISPR-associated endonuclease Cas1 [Peptoanaerobacter stomatis]